MRHVMLLAGLLVLLTAADARAERASVAAGKAVVTASKAAVKAVPRVPGWGWKGLKWVAAHV